MAEACQLCAHGIPRGYSPTRKGELGVSVGSGGGAFFLMTSDELRYVRVGSWQRHVGFRKGGPLK